MIDLDLFIDLQDRDRLYIFCSELIYTDDDGIVMLDGELVVVSGLLDLILDKTDLDRTEHAAQAVDLFDIVGSGLFKPSGEFLNRIAARKWIDRVGNT